MANNQLLYAPDLACTPINPALSCGEEWSCEYDDDDGPITFYIELPPQHNRLNFSCRDKSSGVLLPREPSLQTKEEDECDDNRNDPFFFSPGFYLEAKTGFQPWPGARLMIEAFTCDMKNDRIEQWQTKLRNKDHLNVLEVGGGIGIVGTCIAALGARVTITDLPVLVDHGIIPNLRRNASTANEPDSNEKDNMQIGEGYARATVLDWLKPISEQLSQEQISSFDVIIGCDCLFLDKLVDPFLNTVSDLFEQSKKRPTLLFTYQRRNMKGVFSTLEDLLKRMETRGWSVYCLAWRSITVEGDGQHELYLFEARR